MISSDILNSKIYSCFQWTISLGTLYFSEPASDGSSAKYVALLLILNHFGQSLFVLLRLQKHLQDDYHNFT